jgi:hypothetical protein
MPVGAIGGRPIDPDHGRGGLDELRRGAEWNPHAYPQYGELFPAGIAGARSNGSGSVLKDPAVVDAARSRAIAALAGAGRGIPATNVAGNLPVGVHAATWAELASRFGTNQRRTDLLGQLRPALDALHGAGIERAVIGGSFVTTKELPGDVDLAFLASDAAGVSQAKRAIVQLAARASEVHAYPADALLIEAPTLAGVTPGVNVLEFFQHGREGQQRGVVSVSTAVPG